MRHTIVVGVDGTPGGRRALDVALREAAYTGASVEAVTAWSWDGLEELATATGPRDAEERARRVLDRVVDRALAEQGQPVTVTRRAVRGDAADVLTAASRGADFLVVGTHGYGGIRRAVLGSVSQACLRRATCPVVVVPGPHEEQPARPDLAATAAP